MSEVYSAGYRALGFSIMFLISMVGSLIYLCYFIDRKKTSCIIFIFSLIYSSCFAFLNFIAMLDLLFNNVQGFEKFTKFIEDYYFVFTIVDKVFGFAVFTELIYYLESGHYSTCKKVFDGLYRICYSIKKIPTCEKIVIVSVAVPLIGGILTLLIIYREHFEIKKPWDFAFIFFDCYGIFEIYTFVGFFFVQIFSDCKRQSSVKLTKRYYTYSVTKIIDKIEKYINKINEAYIALEYAIKNYDKTESQEYYNYLNETFQDVQEKMKFYQIKKDYSVFNQNNTNMDYSYSTQGNIYIKNDIQINNNDFVRNNIKKKEAQIQNVEVKVNKNELKMLTIKENELSIFIRKYKKAVRRIEKLKKLYIEIGNEKENDLKNIEEKANKKKAKCHWYYIVLFVAFSIVIVTDIILPFVINSDDDYFKDDEEYKKEESAFGFVVGILLSIPVAVLCSSYTVIKIYSATRRRYITGDYLYGERINDHISLMKTLKLICGYAFALLYCNLYFWKTIDKKSTFGRPKYYDKVIIPDYTIKNRITVYMIVKIVIIIASIIATLKFNKVFIFKNDLAEYNLDGSKYDDESALNTIEREKSNIFQILKCNK